MATVTGLTAARMLDIEAHSITDGEIVGDNLILTMHNGVQIDAGNVRGPQGDTGAAASSQIAEKTTAAAPSTYPVGLTYMVCTTANGWPTNLGTVLTTMLSSLRAFQVVVEKNSDKMWFRVAGDDAWSAFSQIATKAYVDGQITAVNTTISALDTVVKGSEIGNAVDLNTFVTHGIRWQSTDAEAAAGINYPLPRSGVLEVFFNGNTMCIQRYTPYGTWGTGLFYQRTNYNGTWYDWKRYDATDDTGWSTLAITNTTNFGPYGSSPGPQLRRIGKVVNFKGALNLRVAGVADATSESSANQFATIPGSYLPADATNHSVWVCQGSGLNRWQLRINATGAAYAGRYGPSGSIVNAWLPFNVTWFID